MQIQREELINELETVRAGVSPREFIEQSSCFVFQEGTVMTFNDEVACRRKSCISLTGAVQAAALMSILHKLDDPTLLVRKGENGQLEFKGKNKAFGVTMDSEIFLPIDRVETPEKWKSITPDFVEAIGLVMHCVSRDENRFLLTCIHLHPEWVESCDDLQLMRVNINTKLKESVLVRGSSLKHILSLGMTDIAFTESWIHFRNKAGLIYSCRRFAEEYPDVADLLQIKGHKITIPRGLSAASERAAVFAADAANGDSLMKVSLKEGKIRVLGEGSSGWYREVKKAAYKGPMLVFYMSPELLKHVSDNYSDAQINEDKLKVTGGNWEYVTALGKKPKKEEEAEGEE